MKPLENENWLDEALTKAVGCEKSQPDFEKWKQDHPEAVEMLTSRAGQQPSLGIRPLNMRRQIMKSPLTKLATAAIVAIACLIGLSLWRGTESGIALADVLARVEKVKAFRSSQWSSKITGEDTNKPYSSETRGTDLISREYGRKTTTEELDPNGGWSKYEEIYLLPQKKTKISISHKEKEYTREECEDDWFGRTMEWNWANDPRWMVKMLLGLKYESMGRATIDGIEVEGFRTTDPNWSQVKKVEVDAKIWVDVKTKWPVRYDFTTAYFDQMGDKIIERDHRVVHDFQWDVPVDAADFEPPVIPDDYTGTVFKWPSINEENAIQGLKVWVELLGNYPKSIIDMIVLCSDFTALRSAFEKSETPAAMRLKEELKGLSKNDQIYRLKVAILPMRCLNRFRIGFLGDGKHIGYHGKTVTPKDADKVLMRWEVSDNEYRVIYGDLHAETVTREKLAELEAALPK
jgi:hypothetical protein